MIARQVTHADAIAIGEAAMKAILKVQRSGKKLWFKHISFPDVIGEIYSSPYAYVVSEAFLVLYNVGTPWYADGDTKFLEEKLVLRLKEGGDFSDVIAFLEARREAEGAVMVGVGTALAINDAALSRVYTQHGFTPEVTLLLKEHSP